MFAALIALALSCSSPSTAPSLVLSEGPLQLSQDLGNVGIAGSTKWLPGGSYEISGGGGDIWLQQDALQFAHNNISGNLVLQAEVHWLVPSSEPHRKAVLMVRQSLAEDAAYVDATIHENGEAALQYRPHSGAATIQIQSKIVAPKLLRLQRAGKAFTVTFTAATGETESIGPLEVEFETTVLAGLGVCSHDAGALTTARFDQVVIEGTRVVTH